jgi:transposase-like protein
MTEPTARDPIYRRRRFEGEIIELCVRCYISYRLSYWDLVAMIAERGLSMSRTTILRWVTRYVPRIREALESLVPRRELLLESGRDVHPCAQQMALSLSCR